MRARCRLEAQRVTISVVDDQTGSPRTPRPGPGLLELAGRGWTDAVAGQVLYATNAGRATLVRVGRPVFTEIGADPARVQPLYHRRLPETCALARLFGPVRTIVGGRRTHPLRDWRTALGSAVAGQDSPGGSHLGTGRPGLVTLSR